ncbi:hypothetical protein PPROV_000789100 [Pycnococcus provasolii]|uniref:Protein kinase domain-containing protein n=1 Tax=Pycnococcus provasolii TaxID=41880 RepID=A0A830HPQ0_9CHLO|nr:hypothetical protein PPROV_000789100 [Pycnococcus provasolii]
MLSFLSEKLTGAKQFPYVLEDTPEELGGWAHWNHFQGTKRENSMPVSIFKMSGRSNTDAAVQAARNGMKRLRTMRHPNVVRFVGTEEEEDKQGAPSLYLITEKVRPLLSVLRELRQKMSKEQCNEYIAMGLREVTKAIAFLANDCKLVHGNVRMSSIVVTETLEWKLNAFDMLAEHQAATTGEWPLRTWSWMSPGQYKPAEVGKGDWSAVVNGPPYAIDAWGLGCLVLEVFSGAPLDKMEDLRNMDVLPPNLTADYQKLLSSAPNKRLSPQKFLDKAEFLKVKGAELIEVLENINMKDSSEKDIFFRKLPQAVPTLPTLVAQRRVLPLLANALEYGSAPASALTSLLAIGKDLDSDEFVAKVVPCVVKLFASTERSIRIALLNNIESFGPAIPDGVMDEQVYPNLSNGFNDPTAHLRELTLKSIVTVAPKLKQSTINASLLKHLAKLQVDEEPAIRANTTICLSNIAPNMSDAACKRVLLNAFTRALRDGFPPARSAGLMAIVATQQYYSSAEVATRVLPVASPLLVDTDASVRVHAFSLVENMTAALKAQSDKLAAAAEMGGVDPTAANAAIAAANASPMPKAKGGGVLSWAVGSLSASMSKKEGASGSGASTSSAAPRAPASSSAPAAPSRASSGAAAAAASSAAPPAAAAAPSEYSDTTAADVGNGWGDDDELDVGFDDAPSGGGGGGGFDNDDDDDDDGWDDEAAEREAAARARLSARPASRPTPSQPSAAASRGHVSLQKKAPMKLGAQKLGATRRGAGAGAAKDDDWSKLLDEL